ncbi:MAG: hypothetical protein JXB48_07835 [Candidatus Latescibacteria bacterium]|nr:hypothetical protein [Candidatus Latescibacterota bacterium]
MKFFDYFFRKKIYSSPENFIDLSQFIGTLIDNTVNSLFRDYHKVLIDEEITYIVFAVWGAKKDGELTPLQIEINNKIVPVIQQVIEAFKAKNMTDSQNYAIGFLVRGMIIAKITYLIELFKNKISTRDTKTQQNHDISSFLASLGSGAGDNQTGFDDSTWFNRFGDDNFRRW